MATTTHPPVTAHHLRRLGCDEQQITRYYELAAAVGHGHIGGPMDGFEQDPKARFIRYLVRTGRINEDA